MENYIQSRGGNRNTCNVAAGPDPTDDVVSIVYPLDLLQLSNSTEYRHDTFLKSYNSGSAISKMQSFKVFEKIKRSMNSDISITTKYGPD